MQYRYCSRVADSGYGLEVLALLTRADREFVPPLSSRGSTTQGELTGGEVHEGIRDYYASLETQPVILALEEGKCLGFMSFREDHLCEHIGPELLPNLYASTCVVSPEARGRGMMGAFYREMIRLYPDRYLCTRTWHTNVPHLRVLEKLGFRLTARLADHRGPGMDTVYYCRQPGEL